MISGGCRLLGSGICRRLFLGSGICRRLFFGCGFRGGLLFCTCPAAEETARRQEEGAQQGGSAEKGTAARKAVLICRVCLCFGGDPGFSASDFSHEGFPFYLIAQDSQAGLEYLCPFTV
jgi:hypothetical protein